MLPFQQIADGDQIVITGIRTAADADLIDLHPLDLFDRADMIGRMRQGDHRFQLRQIDRDHLVIHRIRICLQLFKIFRSSLLFQKGQCTCIAWKDGGSRAQLCPHVRDRRTLWHAEALHAITEVLHHTADAAFDAQQLQHL